MLPLLDYRIDRHLTAAGVSHLFFGGNADEGLEISGRTARYLTVWHMTPRECGKDAISQDGTKSQDSHRDWE
jgi:hypothetical protein